MTADFSCPPLAVAIGRRWRMQGLPRQRPKTSHALETFRHGKRSQDRARRHRQLVYGRIEPGVLHPRLADDLGGSQRTDILITTHDSKYQQTRTRTTPATNGLAHVGARCTVRSVSESPHQAIPTMPLPQDVKDRYLGAAKFHRALNHFKRYACGNDVP